MAEEREIMEVDVLFVGGGIASLSGALHLANLIKNHNQNVEQTGEGKSLDEIMIAVLEKGAYVGAHGISGAVMNPIERVRQEGLFHPLIEAGSLTHIWLGEAKPSRESLANFVIKTFKHTQNDQIAFSPEFTTCNCCLRTSRSLTEICSYCGSRDVDGITRITGYFTRISSWNKGKIGELHDRYRNQGFLRIEGQEGSYEGKMVTLLSA